jgi:DNA-binding XRE family transcriptional regulator
MNRCKQVREALHMAQQELAVMAGGSPATLVAVERYHYEPGISVRMRIASALRRPVDEIWPPEDIADATGANVQP